MTNTGAPQDAVNHPNHYTSHPSGVECVDIAERMTFNQGNALKYLWRSGKKGPADEDVRKAIWYLRRAYERKEVSRTTVSEYPGQVDTIRLMERVLLVETKTTLLGYFLDMWIDGWRLDLIVTKIEQMRDGTFDAYRTPNPVKAHKIALQVGVHELESFKRHRSNELVEFQKAAGITPDGIVGPNTIAAWSYWHFNTLRPNGTYEPFAECIDDAEKKRSKAILTAAEELRAFAECIDDAEKKRSKAILAAAEELRANGGLPPITRLGEKEPRDSDDRPLLQCECVHWTQVGYHKYEYGDYPYTEHHPGCEKRKPKTEKKPYSPPTVKESGSFEGFLGIEPGELERFRTFYLCHRADMFPPTSTERQRVAMNLAGAVRDLKGFPLRNSLEEIVDRLRTLEVAKLLAVQNNVEATVAIHDTLHILNALSPIR